MRKYILILFACAAILGCKDNPVSKKMKETKKGVSNASNAVREVSKMKEDIEKLQEVTPLTNEELKSLLPAEIKGMKRISYKAGETAMMEIASIRATYANEDKSKMFSVNIVDGAGPTGAMATAGMRMALSQDFEEEDEFSSRRTVMKKGKKAVEEYNSSNNNSSIQFMEDNRFYLEAEGENMDLDETWDAIGRINFNML